MRLMSRWNICCRGKHFFCTVTMNFLLRIQNLFLFAFPGALSLIENPMQRWLLAIHVRLIAVYCMQRQNSAWPLPFWLPPPATSAWQLSINNNQHKENSLAHQCMSSLNLFGIVIRDFYFSSWLTLGYLIIFRLGGLTPLSSKSGCYWQSP